MISTTTILPPSIKQSFNPLLLMNFIQRNRYGLQPIIKLSEKKIRYQDVGKRKKFDQMLKEYKETYVRKEDEQKKFDEETKKKIKERPYLPITGPTMRFTRVETRE